MISCCVAALFRVITSYQYYKSTDQIYDLSPLALWDVVEMTLVIIVACLPSIPALFNDPRLHSLWRRMKPGASPLQSGNARGKLTSRATVESSNRNAYRQLEEHSLSTLAGNIGGNDVSATSHGTEPPEGNREAAQMSILRTTQFTAEVNQDDGTECQNSHDFHIHHPWAKQGV